MFDPQSTGIPWSSEYENWHTRALTHPVAEFMPTPAALLFAVTRSAQAEPEGFTAALFAPGVVVDALGRALQVDSTDAVGLARLADASAMAGGRWVLAQRRTEQPIDRVLVRTGANSAAGVGTALASGEVQGYAKGLRALARPLDGQTELPEVLHEFFGLTLEARTGYVRGEGDREMIAAVKAVLVSFEVAAA